MANWIRVECLEPPKDRVIEVTNGFAWNHKDYYVKQCNKTNRTWALSGKILLAYWAKTEDAKPAIKRGDGKMRDAKPEKWEWVSADDTAPVPSFQFWRLAENPLVNDAIEPQLLSMNIIATERYKGNATRSEILTTAIAVEGQAETIKNSSKKHHSPNVINIDLEWAEKLLAIAQGLREQASYAFDPASTPKRFIVA
jgi:hypothetical protein